MKKKTDYQVGIRTMYEWLKREKKAHQETLNLLGERQDELDSVRGWNRTQQETIAHLEAERIRLSRVPLRPRNVDPTAEVVMNMKKAVEFSINTSAALLDAMGELVDNVSGRKERRERDQERNPVLSVEDGQVIR